MEVRVYVPYFWAYFLGIFPYIGLKFIGLIYGIGTSNQSVPVAWPLICPLSPIRHKALVFPVAKFAGQQNFAELLGSVAKSVHPWICATSLGL